MGGAAGVNDFTGQPIGSMGGAGVMCAALVPAVLVEHDLPPNHSAGTVIELSRITGFYGLSGAEGSCSSERLHGTIYIDGLVPTMIRTRQALRLRPGHPRGAADTDPGSD